MEKGSLVSDGSIFRLSRAETGRPRSGSITHHSTVDQSIAGNFGLNFVTRTSLPAPSRTIPQYVVNLTTPKTGTIW